MSNPTTTKIQQLEARLAEIAEIKAGSNCNQHEKSVEVQTNNSNQGFNIAGKAAVDASGHVGTFSRPSAQLSGNAQIHADGNYGKQKDAAEWTETTIEGDNCTATIVKELNKEAEGLQNELSELKAGKREFDSIYNNLSEENPCITNSDNNYVFTDRKTICRTDEQGNVDPKGKCLTTEHTVDNWPDPAKQTNCSGKMEKGALDVSQQQVDQKNMHAKNAATLEADSLYDDVAEEEVKKQELSTSLSKKGMGDIDFG